MEKGHVWAEWSEDSTKWRNDMTGGYLLGFEVTLKTYGDLIGRPEERFVILGKADIHLTDESWIPGKGDFTLAQHIHMDYNEETNWNEYTLYEYLEDAITCSKYGKTDGVKGTVAVLHKIEILPEFRGKGLFPHFLNSIIHSCRRFKTDYVVLMPHPFGGNVKSQEEKELGILKLRRFYSQFGFHDIPLEKGVPYMALPMKPNHILQAVTAT